MLRHPAGLALLVCLILSARANGEPPPRLDLYGDPLPAGALARLGTVRFRHGSPPHFLMFSPDGKTLLTAEEDGLLSLWDVATGRELRRLEGRFQAHNHVAFSADGQRLSVLVNDQSLQVWDLGTGKELHRLAGPPGDRTNGTLSPDGKTQALIGSDHSVRLWDAADKKLRQLYVRPQKQGDPSFTPGTLAFSTDGKLLAVSGGDADEGVTVRLWETVTAKELRHLVGFQSEITSLVFSPDGKTLCVLDGSNTTSLWNLVTSRKIRQVTGRVQSAPHANSFSPDGKLLVSALEDRILVEEVGTGKEVRQFPARQQGVTVLALSPDGKTFATGGQNYLIRLWDMATGREIRPVPAHQGAIIAVAHSPDGRLLASASIDHTICLWDVAAGREIRRLRCPPLPPRDEPISGVGASLTFSRDGQTLIASWSDGKILLWDVVTGKEQRRHQPGGDQPTGDLAFSPDGKLAAAIRREGLIRLIDVTSGKEIRRLPGFRTQDEEGRRFIDGRQNVVVFAPGSRSLAAAGYEVRPLLGNGQEYPVTVVRIVEIATGRVRRKLQPQGRLLGMLADQGIPVMGVGGDSIGVLRRGRFFSGLENSIGAACFSPDGNLLALGNDSTVYLWDLAQGGEVRRLGGSLVMAHAISFSPDGKLLTTGSIDGTVRLWDVATGTALVRHPGHRGPVLAVSFAPDGKTLVTASADTSLLVWDVAQLLAAGQAKRNQPAPARLEKLWADLAAEDAERAYDAALALAAAPEKAVPLLRGRLRPVPVLDERQLQKHISDLDSPSFVVRRKAAEELGRLGEVAEPALEKALTGKPPLEVRNRVEMLLAKLQGPVTAPERLRQFRAVEVLEKAGTPEARQLLAQLAQGAPGARLTREANEALQRLSRRK